MSLWYREALKTSPGKDTNDLPFSEEKTAKIVVGNNKETSWEKLLPKKTLSKPIERLNKRLRHAGAMDYGWSLGRFG